MEGGQGGPDDVPSLLLSLWRRRWLILIAAAVGILAGLLLAHFQPPEYEAVATMRLSDPETTGVFESDAEVYIARRQDLVTSQAVMDRAAELSPALTAEAPAPSITVEADPALLTLAVVVRHRSAHDAAEIANGVVEAYQQISAERTHANAREAIDELRAAQASTQQRIEELEQQLEEAMAESPGTDEDLTAIPEPGSPGAVIAARLQNHVDQLVAIEARVQEVSMNAEIVGAGVEMFEEATVPSAPVAPRPRLLAALGAMLGMGVAGGFAYWRAGTAARVWTSADPSRILGAPLLGRVPPARSRPRRLPEDLDLSGRTVEAYQFILNSIEHELARIGGSSILVTSAGPGEGKTTACVYLALTAGRVKERSVVLVDADLRRRYLSQLLGGGGRPGLVELAGDQTTTEQAMVRRAITPDVEAWFIPVGDAGYDPSPLRAPAFHEVMWRVRRAADLTIVDSAPILAVVDTTLVANHVDGVVLIVREGTSNADLERVKETMSFVSAPLVGYVYVGVRRSELDAYGYDAERKNWGSLPNRIRARARSPRDRSSPK